MLNSVFARRPRPGKSRGLRPLRLESLERRECLSTVGLTYPTSLGAPTAAASSYPTAPTAPVTLLSPSGPTAPGSPTSPSGPGGPPVVAPPPPALNAPPIVDLLTITYNGRKNITIAGHVTDEQPAGLAVTLSGPWNGTVVTGADGAFSVTVDATNLGLLTATTIDPRGLQSMPTTAAVVSDAPTIGQFSAEVSPNNLLEIEGIVADEDFCGLSVDIVWLGTTYTVTVAQDRTFYWTHQLEPGDEGWVKVQTTDWWGLKSNLCEDLVHTV